MYLSRIAINKGLRKSRQALAFPQMMHAAVLGSFPPGGNGGDENKKRVLWRTDTIGENTWLYVLSEDRPDFSHIVEQFGWLKSNQAWETKDYKPLLDRLEPGQHWRFRLHANPVRTTDGKISALAVDGQKKWLSERAEKNGFSLATVDFDNETYEVFDVIHRNILKFKKRLTDSSFVVLSVATYEGELIVNDKDLLKRTLCSGIGRAKAYGCGLLTLAKLHE
jgi:CRISPR system Cascade subunit CasE